MGDVTQLPGAAPHLATACIVTVPSTVRAIAEAAGGPWPSKFAVKRPGATTSMVSVPVAVTRPSLVTVTAAGPGAECSGTK